MKRNTAGGRGLALASLSLLFCVSCDLSNNEGGPGSGPGVSGSINPAPPQAFLLRASAKGIQPEPNGNSDQPVVSADGRYVAFYSYANNLVAGDTNNTYDVFVRDRDADANGIFDEAGRVATVRVSIGTNGAQGNSDSYFPSISDDGRFVSFVSYADNFDQVTADTNFTGDIFVHDRDTDEDGTYDEPGEVATVRVSVNNAGDEGNNFSEVSDLSADGRHIAFVSYADNLDSLVADTNFTYDIFVHDRDVDGNGIFDEPGNISTRRVSFREDGNQITDFAYYPYITGNGRYVSFYSYDPMALDDTNFTSDVYVHDRDADGNGIFDEGGGPAITRVSRATDGTGADSYCSIQGRNISDDGRFVTFYSGASNLAPGWNGQQHIYLRDRDVSGDGVFDEPGDVSTEIVSTGSNGLANSTCYFPSISEDGSSVAFMSLADNLVLGDTNSTYDVYVRNLNTGVTRRCSISSLGVSGNSYSYPLNISKDGTTVVFRSYASNLIVSDTNGTGDCFARDLVNNRTVRVSEGASTEPAADSFNATISADGDFITYESDSADIILGDTNGVRDIFLRQVSTGVNVRLSVGAGGVQANNPSFNAVISADGKFVTFQSTATNLNAADADTISDVFVRGLSSTVLASRADGIAGAKGNSSSFNPSISADGQWVAFESVATNLNGSDADAINDIYLRDVVNNQTFLVSRATGIAGVKGNSVSSQPFVSATGQFVVFESAANNLVAGDSNGQVDIFLRDRIAGSTVRVNLDSVGAQATGGGSFNASISEDGRFVVFQSAATNLVTPNTSAGRSHVYVRDMLNGTTTLVDNPAGVEADGDAANGMISADGRFIAFDSAATNLVPGDTNTVTDVFRFTMSNGAVNRVSVTPSGVDSLPPTSGISRLPYITATGTAIVFESRAKDLISPPELGPFNDIYRSGE